MSESSDSDSNKTEVNMGDDQPRDKYVTSRATKKCVSINHEHEISDGRKMKNLKVPPFSPDDPEIWFALLEGQFHNFGITDDFIKFNNVVINLDMQHAKAVKDIIINPPATKRYERIKSELIRRLSASHEKKVRQLLTHEELGDRKPSQFLRHLQDLAGPSVPEDFIQSIWCSRLPKNIQTVIASPPTHSLGQLSDLADRIQEITSPGNIADTSYSTQPQTNEIAELRKMVEQLAVKLDNFSRASNRNNDRSSQRSRPQRRRSSSSSRVMAQRVLLTAAGSRHCTLLQNEITAGDLAATIGY